MINYDNIIKENIKYCNSNWPQISNYPYRILIVGGLGSGKTNALLNLKEIQHDDYSITDKVYLNVKDTNEAKYRYLI